MKIIVINRETGEMYRGENECSFLWTSSIKNAKLFKNLKQAEKLAKKISNNQLCEAEFFIEE